MGNIILKQTSSLEKVFLSDQEKPEFYSFSALRGEKFSYQVFYRSDKQSKFDATLCLDSPIKDWVTLYDVGNVPCEMPAYIDEFDDDYITTEPGLFPDVLTPRGEGPIEIRPRTHSIWVDVDVPKDCAPGTYPITVTLQTDEQKVSATFELSVVSAILPKQDLIFTQWFYLDCIANYFQEPVFSDRFWSITENFMKTASECGINMLLTPVVTPPLDTAVGTERLTTQLVDVYLNSGVYSFNFDKLGKWIDLCKKHNIKYLEITHLFTQWGAVYTPKIIAEVDGVQKRIFGWDVRADSQEYRDFLDSFLPALTAFIEQQGMKDYTFFHVSDEPAKDQLESYNTAKSLIAKHLDGYKIIDALSDYEFYKTGVCAHPIVLNEHLGEFIENQVPDLWTYTCCYPAKTYSNRFLAMPSGRNRIIGLQMYKYDIKGFLHWGFNSYHTNLAKKPINPYLVTDAECAFPGGDAFSVYPYKDGAIQSIRSRVFFDALQDMRALKLLEERKGKDTVLALLDQYGMNSFSDYSKDYNLILELRRTVNDLLNQ